jgi:DNA-directed RNA polymerase specialized sigma24 family protein
MHQLRLFLDDEIEQSSPETVGRIFVNRSRLQLVEIQLSPWSDAIWERFLIDRRPRLAGFIRNFTRRHSFKSFEDTDDAIEEIVIKAWRFRHTCTDPDESAHSWLMQLAARKVRDMVRDASYKKWKRSITFTDLDDVVAESSDENVSDLLEALEKTDKELAYLAIEIMSSDEPENFPITPEDRARLEEAMRRYYGE